MEAKTENKMIFKTQKDLKLNLSESTVRFRREGEVNFDNSEQRRTINGHTVFNCTQQLQCVDMHLKILVKGNS